MSIFNQDDLQISNSSLYIQFEETRYRDYLKIKKQNNNYQEELILNQIKDSQLIENKFNELKNQKKSYQNLNSKNTIIKEGLKSKNPYSVGTNLGGVPYIKVKDIMDFLQIKLENIPDSLKKIAENFKCSVCLNLLIDPLLCLSCDTVVCVKCVKYSKCLHIKTPFASDSIYRKILNKLQINCPLNCNKLIKYADLQSHINICENLDNEYYYCLGRDCRILGSETFMKEHCESCTENFIICQYCKFAFPKEFFQSHFNSCMLFEVNCDICNNLVMITEHKNHRKQECVVTIITELDSRFDKLQIKIAELNKNLQQI